MSSRICFAPLALRGPVTGFVCAIALSALSAQAAGDVLVVAGDMTEAAQSVEASQAQLLGFTVHAVPASELASLSTAELTSHRAIVIARSGCDAPGQFLTSLEQGSAAWAAVPGSVLVTLQDPAAYGALGGGASAAGDLARAGILWATAQQGKTGLYANLSCALRGVPAGAVISALSPLGVFTADGACTHTQSVVDATVLAGVSSAEMSGLLCVEQAIFERWPRSFSVAGLSSGLLTSALAAPFALARDATDRVPPDVVISALPTATPDRPLHADGYFSDLGEIQSLRWYLNGNLVGSPSPGAQGTAGIDVTLADGLNTLAFEAIDTAGNRSRTEAVVTYNTNAPRIRLDPVKPSVSIPAITLSGAVSAPGGVASVSVLVDGALAAWPQLAADGGFSLVLPLLDGSHRVAVVVESKARSLLGITLPPVKAQLETAVTVDTVPPEVKVDAMPALTRSQSVTITGQATDARSQVKRVPLTVNGAAMPDATVDEAGRFTGTLWLNEGANQIAIRAFDAAGNEGGTSLQLVLDTLPPTVNVVRPGAAQVFGTSRAELELQVADRSATVVLVDGRTSTLPAGGGRAYATAALPAEGTNLVAVRVDDAAGNSTQRTLELVRDSAAPVLQVDVADGFASGALAGDVLPVQLTVEDTSATTVSTPGGSFAVPAGGGALSIHAPLSEGNNLLAFSATDDTGHSSMLERTVAYDLTAPEGELLIQAGAIVRGAIELRVTATDALTRVASVELAFAGPFQPAAAIEHDTWAAPFDTRNLSDGQHPISARLTDSVGNARVITSQVTVDNGAPEVTLSAPSEGQWIAGQLAVTASASDATTSVKALELRVNERTLARCSASPCQGTFDTRTLPDGAFTVTALATDAAGNSAQVSVRPIADNAAPARFLVSPAPGARVQGSFALSLHVTDAGFHEGECFADGTSLGVSSSPQHTWTIDSRQYLDGPIALRCRAEDLAGNAATEEVIARIDNWSERFSPSRLSLQGSSGSGHGGSVEFWIEGPNVSSLVPHLSHATIWIEGASPVATDTRRSDALAADRDGDGVPELVLRADRKALQRAAAGQPTGAPLPIHLRIADRVVATDQVQLDPPKK